MLYTINYIWYTALAWPLEDCCIKSQGVALVTWP